MKKIEWQFTNTTDDNIIAYGDVAGERMFKITFNIETQKYSAWKFWSGTGYQVVHNHAVSLEAAQAHCNCLTL